MKSIQLEYHSEKEEPIILTGSYIVVRRFLKGRDIILVGLLQLSNHVVQNCHTGEQMTHWDMLNKENSNLVAFFNMSQCVICSPVWQFCTT